MLLSVLKREGIESRIGVKCKRRDDIEDKGSCNEDGLIEGIPHNTWMSLGYPIHVLKSPCYVPVSRTSIGRSKDAQRTSWFIVAAI